MIFVAGFIAFVIGVIGVNIFGHPIKGLLNKGNYIFAPFVLGGIAAMLWSLGLIAAKWLP